MVVWGGAFAPEANAAHAEFVVERVPEAAPGFRNYTSMGVMSGEKLVAAAVFHNWAPEHGVIEIAAASDSKLWLTRPVLKAMFAYVFNEVKCQMALLRVSDRDEKMHRIAKAYGFRSCHVPRLRGRDEGEFILTLTDDAWRSSRFHKRAS